MNSTTAGDQRGPFAATLPSGGQVVVWTSGSEADAGVYAQLLDASGAKVGGEIPVFHGAGPDRFGFSGFRAGGVAALANGSMVVTASASWSERDVGPRNAVYAQVLDASGNRVGPAVEIESSGFGDTVTAGQVHAARDGGYWVEVRRLPRPTPTFFPSAYLQKYDAGGQPVGARIEVDGYPSWEVLRDGNVALAWWVNRRFSSHVSWALHGADGQQLSRTDLAAGPNDFDGPATAIALADGNAAIVWRDEQFTGDSTSRTRTWMLQVLNPAGQRVREPVRLPIQSDTSVHAIALANGNLLLTWLRVAGATAPSGEMLVQTYDVAGQALMEPQVVDPAVGRGSSFPFSIGPEHYALLRSPDGGFVLFSQDAQAGNGEEIHRQRFRPRPPESGS